MSRTLWYFSLIVLCFGLPGHLKGHRNRAKRFLIFPRQAPTRHQFIAGIGIPADLSYESLTVGHVLKAEFFLPYNASVYRQNPFLPEYKHSKVSLNIDRNENAIRGLQNKPSELRWSIYAYLEHILNGYGYKGHECLLQAICEANTIRFSKEFSVVQELLHIILSPSTTLNTDSVEAYDYFVAEKTDNEISSCEIYDCNMRLLDWISKVMQLDV